MSDLPKRKLRWFQFRLRTLMIFVTLAGAFCGLFVLPAIKQRRIAVELGSLGAFVQYDHRTVPLPFYMPRPDVNWLDRLVGYDFRHRATGVCYEFGSNVGQVLKTAVRMPHLESIDLDCSDVTDGDLAEIRRCATLTTLRTGLSAICSTDSRGAHVERDEFRNSHLSAAALSSLENLTTLETLSLSGRTCATDAALVHLEPLKALRSLNLLGTPVSSSGLLHLRGLRHLETLSLGYTKVTDTALVHLEPLQALRSLDLQGTAVSSAGLRHLEGLTHLENLDLDATNVTDEGVADLRRALPNCHITHSK